MESSCPSHSDELWRSVVPVHTTIEVIFFIIHIKKEFNCSWLYVLYVILIAVDAEFDSFIKTSISLSELYRSIGLYIRCFNTLKDLFYYLSQYYIESAMRSNLCYFKDGNVCFSCFILIAIVELYKNILIRDHASSISAMFDLWDSTIYSNKKYRMCTSIKHFCMSFRGSTIPLERLFFIHQRDLGLFQWFLQERQECECSIQEFVVTSICIRNSKHLQWNLWIRNCISFVDFFIL